MKATNDFLANAYDYHETKAYDLGLPFDDFIAETTSPEASPVQHGD